MHRISRITHTTRDYEYGFELAWDEAALMDGAITFQVKASRLHKDEAESVEVPVEVSLYHDEGSAYIRISSPNFTDVEIPVTELFEGESRIEQVLEQIPAVFYGDPVLGCLVRAGVSTSVGRILTCRNKTAEYEWGSGRLRAIGRCLRANIRGMVSKATLRALRCIARFGL